MIIDANIIVIGGLDVVRGCFADSMLRSWNISKGMGIAIGRGHTDSINQLLLFDDQLYSASSDHTVRHRPELNRP